MSSFGDPVPLPEGTSIDVFDDPHGLELYAEAPIGVIKAGDMISIAFYSPRSRPDGVWYRSVIGRVTMPKAGASVLATELLDFLDKTQIAMIKAKLSDKA